MSTELSTLPLAAMHARQLSEHLEESAMPRGYREQPLFHEDLPQQDEVDFGAGSLIVSMAADPRAIDALQLASHY